MSTVKLYIDEDAMDRRFVEALRGRGVDVMTAGETNTTGFSDRDQLDLAVKHGRALYTFNARDFCQLHNHFLAEGQNHAGIIVSSQDYSVGEQMRRVLQLISMHTKESMVNQLIFLSNYPGEV